MYMREQQRGTVSSNLRFPTVRFQQYSAHLSERGGAHWHGVAQVCAGARAAGCRRGGGGGGAYARFGTRGFAAQHLYCCFGPGGPPDTLVLIGSGAYPRRILQEPGPEVSRLGLDATQNGTYVRPAAVSGCPAVRLSGCPAVRLSGCPAIRLSRPRRPGVHDCRSDARPFSRRSSGRAGRCGSSRRTRTPPPSLVSIG